MLAPSTRSGIITPFGSLVEPLVYCRMTSRSGSGDGSSSASPDGRPGPAMSVGHRLDRWVAGRRFVERGELVVDQHELGVAVADAGARRLDEHLERAHPHRQRQHHARQAGEPAALDDGDQRAAGRTEDRHVVAGRQAARLERRADGAGLVVQLAPGDVRLALGSDRTAHEPHAGGTVGGGDEAIDDRRRTLRSHVITTLPAHPEAQPCPGRDAAQLPGDSEAVRS